MQEGYSTGFGYRGGAGRKQKGYRKGTVGVQEGYSRGDAAMLTQSKERTDIYLAFASSAKP